MKIVQFSDGTFGIRAWSAWPVDYKFLGHLNAIDKHFRWWNFEPHESCKFETQEAALAHWNNYIAYKKTPAYRDFGKPV